jgi:hypothetical protein
MSPAAARRHVPGSPFNSKRAEAERVVHFTVGERVCHDRYGLGTVVGTDGETTVDVDFGQGPRRLTAIASKLQKLG